ncbi:ABC transporter permease [Pikeienuella sp. HZG-20]|uniref:ABC transporter permease n=1 Tax=Paludibacillus litoralis TaxID=3133267 RepID=UPI0030EBE4B1
MSKIDPDRHYVADDDYDEAADIQALDRADLDAPTWLLIWRRFLRHRLGVISAIYLATIYLALPFIDFLAPYHYAERHVDHIYADPQPLRLWSPEGDFIGLHTYATTETFDRITFQMKSVTDWSDPQPIPLFANCGANYRLLGLFETNFRLMCPPEGGTLFIFGADRLGRDVHSRIMHGAQLSLTVGLIGVAVSFAIGLTLGGMAGYFGGLTDSLTMRAIEIIRSLPELPIWLALSAAIPATWGPISVFFVISIILGLLDWPGLARAVRSKFLALREEDYVKAAELMGARPRRIIAVHMMPNFMSHLVASATLSIPAMILGETALSFLGLGLRAPAVSWGLMLNDALDLTVVEIYPWLLMPLAPVIMVVLAFSFLGDGLRDALDPYS